MSARRAAVVILYVFADNLPVTYYSCSVVQAKSLPVRPEVHYNVSGGAGFVVPQQAVSLKLISLQGQSTKMPDKENTAAELLKPRFNIKDVTVEKQQRLFKKHFALDEYVLSYKKFAGGTTPPLVRELFERDQDAVAILPYDAKSDEVVLIEQFRPGALKDPVSPWLIEIVAGLIDYGEHEIDAALRELNEEAHFNVTADKLTFLTSVYPSPGGISERVSIYIANVDASHIDALGGLDSENEDIRIFKVPAAAAFAACRSGRICNCAALVALLNLQLAHQDIRNKFLASRQPSA